MKKQKQQKRKYTRRLPALVVPLPRYDAQRDVKLLEEAITLASEWRGGRMPEEWPEFDARISEMRAALVRLTTLI